MFVLTNASTNFRIVALNGSLRKNSIHAGLIQETKIALKDCASVTVFDIGSLPFFNQDLEVDLPVTVKSYLEILRNADGIIIAAPEYNMSFPGVLKNALEWASRTSLGAPMKSKPVALMGATPLTFATAQGQSQLRQVLFAMQVNLVQRPIAMIGMAKEKFDDEGNLHHEETRLLIKQQMHALIDECRILRNLLGEA